MRDEMMNREKPNLEKLKSFLKREQDLTRAARILEFDRSTVCPPNGQDGVGESLVELQNLIFAVRKDPQFIELAEELYAGRNELGEAAGCLVENLHREYRRNVRISPEKNEEFERIKNKAFINWQKAREQGRFELFEPSLKKVAEAEKERVLLWDADEREQTLSVYERLLDEYEPGMTEEVLDVLFGASLERIGRLLKQIKESGKKIRTDFLYRAVTDEQQKQCTDYLLNLLRFDRSQGAFATSEHPYTEMMGQGDVRITSHYYPNLFLSNFYSVLHECGHALFEQLQPQEDHEYFLADQKTMGMHESVSRFYENILGRSRAFIHLVYPQLCRIFPEVLGDVSEEELYRAVNVVEPSLIRTEADELTYTIHIIIRYEMEKEMINDRIPEDLAAVWREKYAAYLGVEPQNDREGILQDIHWTDSFGYFPAYALGNFYNAMFYEKMKQELDVEACIEAGDFTSINKWMAENVFAKADRMDALDWIKDITQKDLEAETFLTYLEEKYRAIYQ